MYANLDRSLKSSTMLVHDLIFFLSMSEKSVDYSREEKGIDRYPEIGSLDHECDRVLEKIFQIAQEKTQNNLGSHSCFLYLEQRRMFFYKFVIWHLGHSSCLDMDENYCMRLLTNLEDVLKCEIESLNDVLQTIREFDQPGEVLRHRMDEIALQIPGESKQGLNTFILHHDVTLMHLKKDESFARILKLFLHTFGSFRAYEEALEERIDAISDEEQWSEMRDRRDKQAALLAYLVRLNDWFIKTFNNFTDQQLAFHFFSNLALVRMCIEMSQLYLRLLSCDLDLINKKDWEVIVNALDEFVQSLLAGSNTLMEAAKFSELPDGYDTKVFTMQALDCRIKSGVFINTVARVANFALKLEELGVRNFDHEFTS